jgi:hypothetical protein
MKRVKLMMVAVLGVIALLLSFAPMPVATVTGEISGHGVPIS